MARSHKERHEWKDRERVKTEQDDPAKIKLHRERFLAELRARNLISDGYHPIVFLARLKFDTDEFTTSITYFHEEIGRLLYLVEDVADTHNLIRRKEPEFDLEREIERLKRHVSSCKAKNHVCHLEAPVQGFRRCESAIPCQWRLWHAELGLAECTR